ncbi:Putative AC9 transposase [Frankliniella fusca]|uniref:AC9 transposase n=1 Tax=Frankliniella fusca TaxID=407009 RepID=A0AAE1GYL9_9NEOP|nr:Putative AC9 transposase [Frankliniella fusca]
MERDRSKTSYRSTKPDPGGAGGVDELVTSRLTVGAGEGLALPLATSPSWRSPPTGPYPKRWDRPAKANPSPWKFGASHPKKRRARGSGKGPSEEDRYAEILGGDRQQPEVWDEVDKYLLIVKTAGNFVKSNDLLKWWKARSADLPVLSRVARMVLATPASSSPRERNFSVAG